MIIYMSFIKSFLLGLVALCLSNYSFGQQDAEPALCKNPSIFGFLPGGTFDVKPQYGCLDFTTTSVMIEVSKPFSPTGGTLNNLGYIFDFKDVNPLTPPTFSPTLQTSTVLTTPGNYWIMQGGNVTGTAYIACKSFEVIQTEQPDFEITTCGANDVVVTFKDTPKNRKIGKYKIIWGDGGAFGESYSAQVTVYPHLMPHTYANAPTSPPQIIAIYTRGAFECSSDPKSFNIGVSNNPRISELEGLNGGASDKITLVEGSDGIAYSIQQKPKGDTWVDTGKKITRNSGTLSANQTIDGLNGSQEYCFRLQTEDACSNKIFSNEVCTIVPKATTLSLTEAQIDWNNPDADLTATPNITRYSIAYSESPSGATNTKEPMPITATTYTFNALDCSKTYNFTITAFLGTNEVVVKSPKVLVTPTTGGTLTSNFVGTASIVNKNIIRVNSNDFSSAPKCIFYRAEDGSSTYKRLATTTDNFYLDKDIVSANQPYCYKVEKQDACGNSLGLSPAFCSVFLTSEKANTLNWTPFIVPDPNLLNPPPDYYVELLDANGSVIKPVDTTPDNELNVKNVIDQVLSDPVFKGQVTFRILARQKAIIIIAGVPTSFSLNVYSNPYTFITPAQIFTPTAFSPNNDNNNDTFLAKGKFISDYNLVIYNRWNNVVFETKDINIGWDGTETDAITPAPPGNYSYKIYGLDPAGQKFEKIGSVILIR
jgi:gliding motility-associated-like protein